MHMLTRIASVTVLMLAGIADAGFERSVAGALAGAGLGLIAANNIDGVSKDEGVAALGVAGALLGYYYDRHHDRGGGLQHDRSAVRNAPAMQRFTPDLHPGVELVKISVLQANGIRTDVPLLRMKDRFIGPQGEEYETLPTEEVLRERYGW